MSLAPDEPRTRTDSSVSFDLIFPTAPVLHVWLELLLLLLIAGSGAAFGVMAGLADLPHLFPGMRHARAFCLLGVIGIILSYAAVVFALITAVFVWRIPRKIVQSADGKRHWSRSIRQIHHTRYTGLPSGNVIFADLDAGVPLPKSADSGSASGESWYQESAYELHTHQRTTWIAPGPLAPPPAVPPSPYS